MDREVVYSLLVAVSISLLLIFTKFGVFRWVYSWITWFTNIIHLRSLPSPPRRWLLGHVLELGWTEEHLLKMLSDQLKYPKWCVYWIGPFIPLVFTSDKEVIKKLLHQPGELKKPRVYGYLEKWLGAGLVLSDGETWKKHRKMLDKVFHLDILKQYIPIINEECDKLLEIWTPLAESRESINIDEHGHIYTLNVFLQCIFSNSNNCLGERKKKSYTEAVNELLKLFVDRAYNPLYDSDFIYYSTAAGRKFLQYCEVVHKFSDDLIMERRKQLLQKTQIPETKYKDLLDILLIVKDENGEGLTNKEIRDEVDTFMFAGYDSTGSGLMWILYGLAKHKEHQELCRKEVRELLADRDSDDITWEDFSKLTYTTMCIKEITRMYTIAPMIYKMASEDIVAGGYKVPKGTWIGVGLYFMHHNPLVWSDPEKFDPQRFNNENSKDMDPFAYLVFSAGPRNCIGQRFALQELKVTIPRILNRFELDVDTTHKIEPEIHGLYKSKTGIKLKVSIAA